MTHGLGVFQLCKAVLDGNTEKGRANRSLAGAVHALKALKLFTRETQLRMTQTDKADAFERLSMNQRRREIKNVQRKRDVVDPEKQAALPPASNGC